MNFQFESRLPKGPQISKDLTYQVCNKMNSDSLLSVDSEGNAHQKINRKNQILTGKSGRRLIGLPQKQIEESAFNKSNSDKAELMTQKSSKRFLRLTQTNNKLIEKFKQNILMNSYVLSQEQHKSKLFQETFTKGDKSYMNEDIANQSYVSEYFMPGSRFLLIWDSISILSNILSFWLGAFLAAFNSENMQDEEFIIFVIIQLVLDMIVSSNRAVIISGEMVVQKKKIFQYYIKKLALNDNISLIIWILVQLDFHKLYIFNELSAIIQIFITLFRLIRKIDEYLENLFIKGALGSLVDLLKLFVSIYFFAHIMACIFYYIGHHTSYLGKSWIMNYQLTDETIWVRYDYAFYWATMTMVTVGYGDVTPQNQFEMAFVNFSMFLSSCVFAYSMNSIGMLLKDLSDMQANYKKSLILMNKYMSKNQVNGQIQRRVRNFLKIQIDQDLSGDDAETRKVIEELPPGLQAELNSDVQLNMIKQIKVISDVFTKQTSKELAPTLKITNLTPGDHIYYSGETDKQNLYYIHEGEVQLLEDNSQKCIQTLHQGQTFGEYSFFTGFPTKSSAKCLTFVQLVKIERTPFIQLVSEVRRDWEKFHHIKDKIGLESNYAAIYLNCSICKKYNHCNVDCPLLTYQPDLESRIKKKIKINFDQKRSYFNREGQKMNTLQISQQASNSIKRFSVTANSNNNLFTDLQLQLSPEKFKRKSDIEQTDDKGSPQLQIQLQTHEIYQDKTITQSKFCMLDEFDKQQESVDIDKVYTFQEYMMVNNIENSLKIMQKGMNAWSKDELAQLQKLSFYTFKFIVKVNAMKLRNYFNLRGQYQSI